MKYAAIDFESYYDADCNITALGMDGYIRHPKFDAYLVSIVADDLEWVGHPKDAPWDKISGPDWEWVAWNASCDERIYHYLREWDRIPTNGAYFYDPGDDLGPNLWHCTADLARYCSIPGGLAAAYKFEYDELVTKDVRDKMKGKLFNAISPEDQDEVKRYCLNDAKMALRFWNDFQTKWPEHERTVSRLSRAQAWHGVGIDLPGIEHDANYLKRLIWEAENLIPWKGTAARLSYDALVAECQKNGIEAPPDTAMVSEECTAWEDKYSDRYPWIEAMRTVRRANALLQKLETVKVRVRPEDGRMPYETRYFGSHTGRSSDGGERDGRKKSSGFNTRNLPRKEMFGAEFYLGKMKANGVRNKPEGGRFKHLWKPGVGVNLRHRIIPQGNNKFVLADLKQIEPRILWNLAGDTKSLDMVRAGMSVYSVHATRTMGWAGCEAGVDLDTAKETNSYAAAVYQLAKARTLALGYQAGYMKFVIMARLYDAEAAFDAEVSEDDTAAFRAYQKWSRVAEWKAMYDRAGFEMKRTYINSWKHVTAFRRSNPLIKQLWNKFQGELKSAIGNGDLEYELPSGRIMTYRNILCEDGQTTGTVIKYGRPMRLKLYGGLITENMCQAIARDVFVEGLLRLNEAGYKTVLDSHDEAVIECNPDVDESSINQIMSTAPKWATFPVAASVRSTMHYTK